MLLGVGRWHARTRVVAVHRATALPRPLPVVRLAHRLLASTPRPQQTQQRQQQQQHHRQPQPPPSAAGTFRPSRSQKEFGSRAKQRSKMLMSHLGGLQRLSDVVDVVREEAANFDPLLRLTALCRLATLHAPDAPCGEVHASPVVLQLVEDVKGDVRAQPCPFRAYDLVVVGWSVAKLAPSLPPSTTTAVLACVRDGLQHAHLVPKHLALVTWAFAKGGLDATPVHDMFAPWKDADADADTEGDDGGSDAHEHARTDNKRQSQKQQQPPPQEKQQQQEGEGPVAASPLEAQTSPTSGPLYVSIANECASRKLRGFSPQDISNVVWAMGTTSTRHARLLLCATQEATPMIDRFTPQAVSNLVWSFARLGVVPAHHPLFHAIAVRLTRTDALRQFKAMELVVVAYSFARAKLPDPELFSELAREAVRRLRVPLPRGEEEGQGQGERGGREIDGAAPAPPAPPAPPPAAAAAAAAPGKGKAGGTRLPPGHELSARDVATLVWAFSKAKLHSHTLFDAVALRVVEHADEFLPHELCQVAWSFAHSDHRDVALFDVVSRQAAMPSFPLSPQVCANLLWAFARSRVRARDLFVKGGGYFVRHVEQFSPQGVADVAWAFAKSRRHTLPLPVTHEVLEVLVNNTEARLHSFRGEDMANLAWALFRCDRADPQLFATMAECARTALASTPSWAVVELVCLVHRAGVQNRAFFAAANARVQRLADKLTIEELTAVQRALKDEGEDVSALVHFRHKRRTRTYVTPNPLVDDDDSE